MDEHTGEIAIGQRRGGFGILRVSPLARLPGCLDGGEAATCR